MNAAKPDWCNVDQGKGINDNERGNLTERGNMLTIIRVSVVLSRRVVREEASAQNSPDCSLAFVNLFLQKSCAN